MTDVTYAYARCRARDVHHFEKLGYEKQHEADGVVELYDECVNYGGVTELQQLAKDGIAFYSWHGSGAEYGPCVQASDGKRFIDVAADLDEFPVIKVLENGRCDRRALKEARKYWKIYKQARVSMGRNDVIEKTKS